MINKQLLALAMMMGTAGEGLVQQFEEKRASCVSNNVDKIDTTVHEVVPKGAKRFYFTENGRCFESISGNVNIVYDTIALSRKRAIKKFEKWETAQ